MTIFNTVKSLLFSDLTCLGIRHTALYITRVINYIAVRHIPVMKHAICSITARRGISTVQFSTAWHTFFAVSLCPCVPSPLPSTFSAVLLRLCEAHPPSSTRCALYNATRGELMPSLGCHWICRLELSVHWNRAAFAF